MGGRVAGICFVKCDGEQLEIKGKIEAPLIQFAREAVMSLAGQAGYKETAQRQFLKLDAIFTRDFPLNKLAQGTNMTVTAELANGMVYTLTNAHVEGEMTGNGEEGSVDIEFCGITGVWH
jgi:hypothetical protein